MLREIAIEGWSLCCLDEDETMWGYDLEGFIDNLKTVVPPIEVKIHTCTIDCGDGSSYDAMFKTAEGAEARNQHEEDSMGYTPCEAVSFSTFTVDWTGTLVSGNDYISEDDDGNETYED